MFEKNRTKLYKVEFLRYTNVLEDTVSNMSEDFKITGNEKYIDATDLIVKEQDLEYYRQFGGGIKNITFVGYLGEPKGIV